MEPRQSQIVIDFRQIAGAVLALLLLIGSMPLTTGVSVGAGPSHPELAMNFCHPLERAATSGSLLIARPALAAIRPILVELERLQRQARAPISEFSLEPESPPPKTAA